jgi:hypothetical protein
MGTLVPSGFDAPIRLARALERGEKAAMLIDQHDSRGVDVTFFGRVCKASPLVAQLARHLDCPIHGVRVVRQADRNTFWCEVTDPIEPVRDADGQIDVRGTTQAITNVVEAWITNHSVAMATPSLAIASLTASSLSLASFSSVDATVRFRRPCLSPSPGEGRSRREAVGSEVMLMDRACANPHHPALPLATLPQGEGISQPSALHPTMTSSATTVSTVSRDAVNYRPVLTRVHSRFSSRTVAASCALTV